jgi:hypothetical protein
MKSFLGFVLVLLTAMSQAQTRTDDAPGLVVVKFSCGRYETGSGMIRSVNEPDAPKNEPIRINQTIRNEPQEVINRRDMNERRAELAAAEVNATLSSRTGSNIYFYRLRIKNASTKIVKSFAWEYQAQAQVDPADRQFYCAIKAKPNESKEIKLFTPLAPSHVVEAAKAGHKSAARDDAKVVFNKIEYLDGTSWKRKGWNSKTFPDDAIQQVAAGKCIGL